MTDITIKQKMLLGSIIPVGILIAISLLAMSIMSQIEQGMSRVYNDRVVPLEDLKIIGDDYAVSVIDAINKANAGDFSADKLKTH